MCPMEVAEVIFKCFSIACSSRPGQSMKWPFLTACIRADCVVLSIALYKSFATPAESCWFSCRKLIHQTCVPR
jgi:hypothetical protein